MTGRLDYSPCNSCHRPIKWEKTDGDKKTPVNPNGSSHWGTCTGAPHERRRAKERRDLDRLAAWTDAAKGAQ
jgi:hypothetical protein